MRLYDFPDMVTVHPIRTRLVTLEQVRRLTGLSQLKLKATHHVHEDIPGHCRTVLHIETEVVGRQDSARLVHHDILISNSAELPT